MELLKERSTDLRSSECPGKKPRRDGNTRVRVSQAPVILKTLSRGESVGVVLDGIAGMFQPDAREERAWILRRKAIVAVVRCLSPLCPEGLRPENLGESHRLYGLTKERNNSCSYFGSSCAVPKVRTRWAARNRPR